MASLGVFAAIHTVSYCTPSQPRYIATAGTAIVIALEEAAKPEPPAHEAAPKPKSKPKPKPKPKPLPVPPVKAESKPLSLPKPEPDLIAVEAERKAAEKAARVARAEAEAAREREEARLAEAARRAEKEARIAEESYFSRLYATIASYKSYPSKAKRFGIEGEVCLCFVIDDRGRIVRSEVMRSSGQRMLESAAEGILEQIRRFEAPPEGVTRRRFEIIIDYHLS